MSETNMKSSSDPNTTDALRSILKEVGFIMEEVEFPRDEDSPPAPIPTFASVGRRYCRTLDGDDAGSARP